MTLIVLRMGKHMPDIDLFPVIVNGNNQAIFVSCDIENRRFSDLICGGKRDPQLGKRGIVRFANDSIPTIQGNPCIGMRAGELNQSFSRDDMQTKTEHEADSHCKIM